MSIIAQGKPTKARQEDEVRSPAALLETRERWLATEKLTVSRQRIQQFLDRKQSATYHPGKLNKEFTPGFLQRLRTHPLGATVVDTIHEWWHDHPLFSSARVVRFGAERALGPIAKRHPKMLVGSALVAGGVIFWARPWRWLLRPALIAGAATQLASRLIARVPAESIMSVATSLFTTSNTRDADRQPKTG